MGQTGWAGDQERPWLSLAVADVFHSWVSVQTFLPGAVHGGLAWQRSWTRHLFEPKLPYLWK